MSTIHAPHHHDLLAMLRPKQGTLRSQRSHVLAPDAMVRTLDREALWDFRVGSLDAAQPIKLRHDRGVFAATISMPEDAQTAKENEATLRVEVIIKVFRERSDRRTLDAIRHRLGRSRAAREWAGLWRLKQAGIAAAEPYLICAARAADGTRLDLLVLQRVPGIDLLHAWANRKLNGPDGDRTLKRVGEQVGRMMNAGPMIFNRDHKASNIIVQPTGEPVIVDAAGVGRWRFQRPTAMLAKLWIETLGVHRLHPELTLPSRSQRWRVLRGYCQVALGGWAYASPASQRLQIKAAWRAIARLVDRHGDPTPVDDPLGSA